MALRNVVCEGDGILRKNSKPVKEITDRITTLLDDMWETMYENNGAGLAAPQVGVLRRVVVIDVTPPEEEEEEGCPPPEKPEEQKYELINPEIIEMSEELVLESEGCLSIPGVVGMVERPAYIKIKATDRDGKEITVEGEGMLAKAICHELDHLNGVLFIDKVVESEEEEEE